MLACVYLTQRGTNKLLVNVECSHVLAQSIGKHVQSNTGEEEREGERERKLKSGWKIDLFQRTSTYIKMILYKAIGYQRGVCRIRYIYSKLEAEYKLFIRKSCKLPFPRYLYILLILVPSWITYLCRYIYIYLYFVNKWSQLNVGILLLRYWQADD